MMAKPMKTLELHYPMIQFIISRIILCDSTARKKTQESLRCYCNTVYVVVCLWRSIKGYIALFFSPRQFLHELEACAKNPDEVPKVMLRHVSDK